MGPGRERSRWHSSCIGGSCVGAERKREVPSQVGLAGFNGVELLQGLPRQLATMDSCRVEIGQAAAKIVLNQTLDEPDEGIETRVTLTPTLAFGDTLRRHRRT